MENTNTLKRGIISFCVSFAVTLCLILCANIAWAQFAPTSSRPIEWNRPAQQTAQPRKQQTQPKKNSSSYKKRCFPYDKWYHVKKWLPLYVIVLAVFLIYFMERKDRNYRKRLAAADKLIDSYENELGVNCLSQKERQQAGEEYEKYIARIYRRNGYTIKYNGIIKGYNDEGIDLICSKKGEPITLVQCKNWAKDKIIHENYIFAVYGAGKYYRLAEEIDEVKIVFYCTCPMSNQAKIIGRKLGIEIHDEFKMLSKQ